MEHPGSSLWIAGRKSANQPLRTLPTHSIRFIIPANSQTKAKGTKKRKSTSQPTWEAEAGSTFPKVRILPTLRGDILCGGPLSSCAWARRFLIGDGTSARSAKQHEKERLGLVPGLVSVVVGAAADPFDGYQGRCLHPNSLMVVLWDIGESCLWPEDILGRTEGFWSEIETLTC